ncbi:ABC transporter permease [Terrabacter sp. AAH1]|jgi:ABC-type transport system involved in multi-copper enzyme maturation permease subunit|nr:ABC transporter permease [Terrabacter sp. 28]
MTAVRAELRKFFTTRLWWGMAIAVLVSGAAFAVLFAFFFTSDAVQGPQGAVAPRTDAAIAKAVFTGGLQVGYLLTLAVGVLTIGSEYRHQTITATFLAIPRRGRVMAAKVAALLVIGAFYGVLSLAGAVGAGSLVLTSKGVSPYADTSIWRTLALCLLVLGLWAMIGLGAGILIPNQVAALLISVAVAWIVEPVLSLVLALTEWGKSISPYLPSRATSAMVEATSGGFDGQPVEQLSWWAGALVLTAYAVVMAGLGTWRTLRSDIS